MPSTGTRSRTDTAGRVDGSVTAEAASPEQIRDERIEQAAHLAPEMADLIRLYFRYMPPEEIIDDNPVDLVGAVRSHRELAADRVPGRPAVRIFNPNAAADGWTMPGTVVQLVTDDMPYLVESVTAELTRSGLQVHRVVHPIVVVRRDVAGRLREVLPTADPDDPPADALAESWMSIEVDLITDADRSRDTASALLSVLNAVREVVEDTDRMIGTARALADQLEAEPPPLDSDQVADGAALLRWLAGGHFTFLGYRNYELVRTDQDGQPALRAVLASGLGVLRQDSRAARAGQLPFRGNTPFETSAAIMNTLPAPLPSRVPPGLWSIIQRCLSKEPSQRYQRASEVQAALEAVESASMTAITASSQPSGLRRWSAAAHGT